MIILKEPGFPLRLYSNRVYVLHAYGCVVQITIDGNEFGAQKYNLDQHAWECPVDGWPMLLDGDGIKHEGEHERLRFVLELAGKFQQ